MGTMPIVEGIAREDDQASVFSYKAQAEGIFKKLLIIMSQILNFILLSIAGFVNPNCFPQTVSPLCTFSSL